MQFQSVRFKRFVVVVGLVLGGLLLGSLAHAEKKAAPTAVKTSRKGWPSQESVRASRRSFYTAPPVIPHVVDPWQNGKTCLTCHAEIREWRGNTSMLTPHPQLSNCQQCHVQGVTPDWQPKAAVPPNRWKGLPEPRKGSRANAIAPPTVPHREFMRENCAGCHSDHPAEPLKGPHANRSNCVQCHVTSGPNEFTLEVTE